MLKRKTSLMKTIIFFFLLAVGPLTTQLQSQTLSQSKSSNDVLDETPKLQAVETSNTPETEKMPFQDSKKRKGKNETKVDQPETNGVVIIQTTENSNSEDACTSKNYPFTVYCLKNDNWILPQDILIALRAKIPSINVSNDTNPFATPRFRIRGEADPIILIDGIRVDASILNNLNPNDIESIMVAPSAAGVNHFLNGYRAY